MVHHGKDRFDGFGYAECLRVTVPPSRLPFHTLRWGRHLSEHHSLVWIAWTGDTPRTWVWLDGVAAPQAIVTDTGLVGLPHDASLVVRDSRTILDHRVPCTALREHKQLGRSALVTAGRPLDHGWTVHEVVTR